MFAFGRYAAFIWPAYIISVVVIAAMIIDTWLRARRWRREAARRERERDGSPPAKP